MAEIDDIFRSVLLENDDVFRDRRSRFEDDTESFKDTLEDPSSSSDFDIDGGVDVGDESEKIFLEVLENLEAYKQLNSEMLSDLKKLAKIDRNDSIANGLTEPLKKIIEKDRNNIGEIVNKLEVTEAVSDKIKQRIASLKG